MALTHDEILRAAESVQRAAIRAEPYGLASLGRTVDILERELAAGPKTDDEHENLFRALRDVRRARRHTADPTAIDQLQRLHKRIESLAR